MKARNRIATTLVAALATLSLAAVFRGGSPTYEVWYSIDNGGIVLTTVGGSGFELTGTIGQFDAGEFDTVSGDFTIRSGFMAGLDLEPITRLYVDQNATGAGDGLDWNNAFVHLQDALAEAVRLENDEGEDIQEIWVARGVYRPDTTAANPAGTNDPTASFTLLTGVAIYGGFAGNEATLDARALTNGTFGPEGANNPLSATILTGEIGAAGTADNTHHVVVANGTDLTARLDGVTISDGNANGSAGAFEDLGGGLYNPAGAALLARCTFLNNDADTAGGAAIVSGNAATTFVNCRFLGNSAGDGGAVYLDGVGNAAVFVNCAFTGNDAATGSGGAIHADSGTAPTFANCAVYANAALFGDAGGLYVNGATVSVDSSILWENLGSGGLPDESAQASVAAGTLAINYSNIQGFAALGGIGNIGNPAFDDPVFNDADGPDDLVGTPDDDLRIGFGSPCVDAGNNAAVTGDLADLDQNGNTAEQTPLDLFGSARFSDDPTVSPDPGAGTAPVVDMGPHEFEFTDCNNNGVLDSFDIDPADPDGNGEVSEDCQPDGIPDECQLSGPMIFSQWVNGDGSWNVPTNWCPGLDFPNNEDSDPTFGLQRFFVEIDPVGGAVVSLNTSPTISQLTLGGDSEIRLSGGTNRSLSFQDPGITSTSAGDIRVQSSNLDILLTLSDMNLIQDPNALLEADGVNSAQLTVLRLVDSIVTGGRLQAVRGGTLRLFNTTLEGVRVLDALVEDNNTSRVANTINNVSEIRVGELGQNATLAPNADGATLSGTGRVLLIDETDSTLGGGVGLLTNDTLHRVEGAGLVIGEINNLGRIEANTNAEQMTIAGPGMTFINAGTLAATNGGILAITRGFTGGGRLIAQGGVITIDIDDIADIGNSGEIEVLPGSLGYLYLEDGTRVDADSLLVTGGEAYVRSGAILNLTGNATIAQDPNKVGAVAHWTIDAGGDASVAGLVLIGSPGSAGHVVVNGTLQTTLGVVLNEGTLSGSGSIVGPVTNIDGTVSPGTSPGTLSIGGGYDQQGGTLRIELQDFNEFDQVLASSIINLGGTLEVVLLDGYVPAADTEFTILSGSSIAGSFAQELLPSLPKGRSWEDEVVGGTYRLRVVCDADVDGNGTVDLTDLALVLSNFGRVGAGLAGDADEDGDVDLTDLATVLGDFGASCN